ncbi:MAG: hypothetical protein C5B43_01665 [Verrucomicrobia bacterium]|nr:MAG: hypothetical protein C5B43_01665 [Verrucomicrobiota bacterium]
MIEFEDWYRADLTPLGRMQFDRLTSLSIKCGECPVGITAPYAYGSSGFRDLGEFLLRINFPKQMPKLKDISIKN